VRQTKGRSYSNRSFIGAVFQNNQIIRVSVRAARPTAKKKNV
jgi:hypothetical protein